MSQAKRTAAPSMRGRSEAGAGARNLLAGRRVGQGDSAPLAGKEGREEDADAVGEGRASRRQGAGTSPIIVIKSCFQYLPLNWK